MKEPITKSSLTDRERRLIRLLSDVNFGRIEHLQVRSGQPELEPAPNIIETRKMGSPRGPREEASLQDFWLKQPVADLLATIREIGDGEILSITLMHGLPHVVEIRHHVPL